MGLNYRVSHNSSFSGVDHEFFGDDTRIWRAIASVPSLPPGVNLPAPAHRSPPFRRRLQVVIQILQQSPTSPLRPDADRGKVAKQVTAVAFPRGEIAIIDPREPGVNIGCVQQLRERLVVLRALNADQVLPTLVGDQLQPILIRNFFILSDPALALGERVRFNVIQYLIDAPGDDLRRLAACCSGRRSAINKARSPRHPRACPHRESPGFAPRRSYC